MGKKNSKLQQETVDKLIAETYCESTTLFNSSETRIDFKVSFRRVQIKSFIEHPTEFGKSRISLEL